MNKSRRTLCRHVGLALCLLMIFTVLPVPVAASETKTDTESKTDQGRLVSGFLSYYR